MRSIIASIRAFFEGADAPTEADSPRDGVFSYASEWHAFQIGLAVGFGAVMPSEWLKAFVYEAVGGIEGDWSRSSAMREVRKEGWYGTSGMLLGVFLALAAAVTAAAIGLSLT